MSFQFLYDCERLGWSLGFDTPSAQATRLFDANTTTRNIFIDNFPAVNLIGRTEWADRKWFLAKPKTRCSLRAANYANGRNSICAGSFLIWSSRASSRWSCASERKTSTPCEPVAIHQRRRQRPDHRWLHLFPYVAAILAIKSGASFAPAQWSDWHEILSEQCFCKDCQDRSGPLPRKSPHFREEDLATSNDTQKAMKKCQWACASDIGKSWS